jgi:Protein of unknown function (DUF2934)
MAKKRTKADRLQRQTEQQEQKVDRRPEEVEKTPSTLAPKSDEPTVLIPIEQQIQKRAYELYEQRGRTNGHELDDWLQAECEIKGTQPNAATA